MQKKLIVSLVLILSIFIITGCNEVNHVDLDNVETYDRENLTDEEINYFLNRISELRYIDFYGKSINISDLANQEVLQILNHKYDGLDGVSFQELETVSQNYFGYYLNPEDVLCDTHFNILGVSSFIYYYDSNTKLYNLNKEHISHNLIGVEVNVVDLLKDSYKEADTYTINVYKVFSELLNSTNTNVNNYYRTYNEALNKENMIFTTTGKVKVEMNNYKESLRTYTYTFSKKGDNYILKDYKIN